MSVLIKRSASESHIPNECPYGCCTTIYGKNVKFIRRAIKRRSNQEFKKELKYLSL